jgi:hypothetical protein
MKDMASILHKTPDQRREEAKRLLIEMQNQPKIKKCIDEWGLQFDPVPVTVEG